MLAMITVHLRGARATAQVFELRLKWAAIMATLNRALRVDLVGRIDNVALFARRATFGTVSGATFDGSILLPLAVADGETPEVRLVNFAKEHTATVTWATARGPVTQALRPGTALALVGIVGSDLPSC